jgi:hypothetical protein
MRKTALVGLAALAASALTMMAQSNVYSLNVVGYVNTVFPADKYVLVVAPLDAGTNNLTTLIPSAPNGTRVLTWNATSQGYDGTQPAYSTKSSKWSPDNAIPAGKGFFVTAKGAAFTNTWVGNVWQGALSNSLSGNSGYDLIGSLVPIGGSLTTNVLAQYPGVNGDRILTWNVTNQAYDGTQPAYSSKSSRWSPDDATAGFSGVQPAQAFFLIRKGAPVVYVRNFTVP